MNRSVGCGIALLIMIFLSSGLLATAGFGAASALREMNPGYQAEKIEEARALRAKNELQETQAWAWQNWFDDMRSAVTPVLKLILNVMLLAATVGAISWAGAWGYRQHNDKSELVYDPHRVMARSHVLAGANIGMVYQYALAIGQAEVERAKIMSPETAIALASGSIKNLNLGRAANSPRLPSVDTAPQLEQLEVASPIIAPRQIELTDFGIPEHPLMVPVGMLDGAGELFTSLRQTHILVGGSTRMGKTNVIQAWVKWLFARHTPDTLRAWFVDPKRTGFAPFEHSPMTERFEDEQAGWERMLLDLENERATRQEIFKRNNISEWTPDLGADLPFIVVIIDEIASITQNKATIQPIIDLLRMAAGSGICVIAATQYVDGESIPLNIRSQMLTKMCFKVGSSTESSIILSRGGAERLPGKGWALVQQVEEPYPQRVQVPHAGPLIIEGKARESVKMAVPSGTDVQTPSIPDRFTRLAEIVVNDIRANGAINRTRIHKLTGNEFTGQELDEFLAGVNEGMRAELEHFTAEPNGPTGRGPKQQMYRLKE